VSDAELADDLRLHAFDDCDANEPPPTHICVQAAARITALSSERDLLREALTDARNNILSLLGGFRDDMPDVAVKLFQAQVKQIDAALTGVTGG
jgi:hypothetical protein